MNINFGMDNFYVRYLKRFLNSEFHQTNTILGDFDKNDQQLLIQYLNLPNVEPMSTVQKDILSKFPKLKDLFIMTIKDNYIIWTSREISTEASEYIREILDDLKDYCKSVGWHIKDAYEWVDDLMDLDSNGVVNEKEKLILQDIIYNNVSHDTILGRIEGTLKVENYDLNWSKLNATATIYDPFNTAVKTVSIGDYSHSYQFRDLDAGVYNMVISAPGYLDIRVNNIYVKDNYISKVPTLNFIAGDVDHGNIINIIDLSLLNANLSNVVDSTNIQYDLNRDGVIDAEDANILTQNFGKSSSPTYWNINYDIIPHASKYPDDILQKADINLDGSIDKKDLDRLISYLANGRLYIEIEMDDRRNFFPNKDMLAFVNQFDGTFLYNYAIKSANGYDNFPHKDPTGTLKLALYKCTPNQKITIAHNNNRRTKLVIGSSPARLQQDVTAFMTQNVVEVELNPGDHYEYQTSGSETGTYDAQWVLIQCPSDYGNLNGSQDRSMTIELGDVNFDGKIDMEDYKLISYYCAQGDEEVVKKYHWDATPKQLAAMDIYGDGSIKHRDPKNAVAVYKFINGTWDKPSLGLGIYNYKVPTDYEKLDNVSNLLIIDGWWDDDVGIPYLEFALGDEWIIHNKFFNYLFNMAVTKYSNSESITFVQQFLKEYYPYTHFGTDFLKTGFYTDTMRDMIKEYQRSKIEYTYGDLSQDGKLDEDDLIIFREYLYGLDDNESNKPITLQKLRDYLDGTAVLTATEMEWADVDRDGYITEKDYSLLKIYMCDADFVKKVRDYLDNKVTLTDTEKELADRNGDGLVTEADYVTLSSYPRVLTATQRTYADTNHDGTINYEDYKILESNVKGLSDSLKIYNISFALGWYDMQTEKYMEQEYNSLELISEVSK